MSFETSCQSGGNMDPEILCHSLIIFNEVVLYTYTDHKLESLYLWSTSGQKMDSENCEQSTASTFEIITTKDRRIFQREGVLKKFKYILLFACLMIVVTGITVVLVVFFAGKASDSQTVPKGEESSSNKTKKEGDAHEILKTFLTKVHDTYFEFCPDEIVRKMNLATDEFRAKFRPFDYSPDALRRTADVASQLRTELGSLFTAQSEATLTPRELRALYEARTFLRYLRGPYDTMYYSGDWMLGPNAMVWQPLAALGPIATVIGYAVPYLKPRNIEEAEKFIDLLAQHNRSITHYMGNMKMGVQAGMVRNIEACKDGLLALKSIFHWSATDNGKGILSYIQLSRRKFLEHFTDEMKRDWDEKYGKNITSSLNEALVRHIGKPYSDLIRYIENEHMQHCVPSNVSSGLASLPLTHVYVNGVPDLSRPTHPYLPSGERLNGSKSFVQLLSYFTTNEMTPKEIKELGQNKLKELYGKALTLAKEVTNETNTSIAVRKFRALLTHRSQFFNIKPFSVNESTETDAFLRCYDETSARKHCPERWEAFTKWKNSTESIHRVLHSKIKPLFYTSGKKKTTLSDSCTGIVLPNFNPCSSYHTYSPAMCGVHYLPFFVDNFGPRFSEWTTTAHETEPGHTLEVNGYLENFDDKRKDVISWLTRMTYFSGFSEGWAVYSENPLVGEDIDAYRSDLMSKYGMLQQEIITAIRLLIETGLHYYGMSRSEALKLFDDYAWETSDIANKEVTRYQSLQGHSVSYMIGQTALIKARTFVEKQLGSNFSLPEFHYQVLHQGELTLDYLDVYVRLYVACVNGDPGIRGCDGILE